MPKKRPMGEGDRQKDRDIEKGQVSGLCKFWSWPEYLRISLGSKLSFTEMSSEKKAKIAKDMAGFGVWKGEY